MSPEDYAQLGYVYRSEEEVRTMLAATLERERKPAGILIGIEDPEDWWEEALLRHPLFQKRIAQARQSARERKGITIEQLRAELQIDAPDVTSTPGKESEQDPSSARGDRQATTTDQTSTVGVEQSG